jgi:predicted RNA-binding protein with PIN domain
MQVGIANLGPEQENDGVERRRYLVIDGYNVLYAWKWMRARDAKGGLGSVRTRLVEALRPIRDGEEWVIAVVFDGRGSAEGQDTALSETGFSVIFAPEGRTADDVIESMVSTSQNPASYTVVTGDALERETVTAAGAACLSPAELGDWCERCRDRAVQSARRRSARQGGAWGNRLPL